MVKYDRAEVATVVVYDEIFSGVGALQAACPDTLMLQQCLVQSKEYLQGKTQQYGKDAMTFCIHKLSSHNTVIANIACCVCNNSVVTTQC